MTVTRKSRSVSKNKTQGKIVKKKIEIDNIYYNGLKNNKNFFSLSL